MKNPVLSQTELTNEQKAQLSELSFSQWLRMVICEGNSPLTCLAIWTIAAACMWGVTLWIAQGFKIGKVPLFFFAGVFTVVWTFTVVDAIVHLTREIRTRMRELRQRT